MDVVRRSGHPLPGCRHGSHDQQADTNELHPGVCSKMLRTEACATQFDLRLKADYSGCEAAEPPRQRPSLGLNTASGETPILAERKLQIHKSIIVTAVSIDNSASREA